MGKLPLRFIPVGELKGDHEGLETLSLPGSLNSSGSKDILIDKSSRLTSINGYVRQNAAGITTTADGQPTRLRYLYHYITTAGVRQQIGVFTTDRMDSYLSLQYSLDLGVTWTMIQEFKIGADYVNIPSFTQLGSALLIAFGAGYVKQWNGAALTDVRSVQGDPPGAVFSGAGNLNGTYRWKVIARKADGSRKPGSQWSAYVAITNGKALVTWNADAEANSYEVYRTTGTGDIAFYVGTTAAGTLNLTDDISDIRLQGNRMLQEYGDAPPQGAGHVFTHKDRVFYLNFPGFPRRGYYADPGLPASVNLFSSFFDFTDANDADFADEALGGYGGFRGSAVVFCERSVWMISGTGLPSGVVVDLNRRKTDAQTGTVSERTVIRVPAGAHYFEHDGTLTEIPESVLAYITPLGELRVFDGGNDRVISHAKADLFHRLNYAARRKAFAFPDTLRNELVFVFPTDTEDEPNVAVAWNYRFGTMVEREWPFAHAAELESSSTASIILAGEPWPAVGGFCYRLWQGLTTPPNGTPVNAQIMTKTFYGAGSAMRQDGMSLVQLMQYDKRWRWIELLIKSDDATLDLLVEWWPGEAKPNDIPYGSEHVTWTAKSQLFDSDGNPLKDGGGNFLYAPTTTQAPLRVKLKKDTSNTHRYLHSRGIRFRVSSQSVISTWSLCGIFVAYQLLSGLRRDFRR